MVHTDADERTVVLFHGGEFLVVSVFCPKRIFIDYVYPSGMDDDILSIRTYYEQQWLDRGLNIKYIQFHLPQDGELQEPDVEIELDDYRSYNRSKRSGLKTSK